MNMQKAGKCQQTIGNAAFITQMIPNAIFPFLLSGLRGRFCRAGKLERNVIQKGSNVSQVCCKSAASLLQVMVYLCKWQATVPTRPLEDITPPKIHLIVSHTNGFEPQNIPESDSQMHSHKDIQRPNYS